MTYGLTNFDLVEISKSNELFDKVEVWLGKKNYVEVYTKENIYKTIKKAKKKLLKVKINIMVLLKHQLKKIKLSQN